MPPPLPDCKPDCGFAAVSLALFANAVVVGLSLKFYFVPAGSDIRDMSWAGCCAMVAFAALGIVPPMAIVSIRQKRRYLLPVLAIILSLLPFPVAGAMLHHAAAVRGFTISI